MKNLFNAICILLFLTSCGQIVPLKGSYPTSAYKETINKPIDQVWDNLIDIIADYGYEPNLLDKNSGFMAIRSVRIADEDVTIEDKKGAPLKPNALVITEKLDFDDKRSVIAYNRIESGWNVRLRSLEENKTLVSVFLYNINVNRPEIQETKTIRTHLRAYSLHNFEKMIVGRLK